MMDLEGANRPAVYLAYDLIKKGYKVSIVSPVMPHIIERYLHSVGIIPINLRVKLFSRGSGLSPLWFELWWREAFFRLNSKNVRESYVTINFSHTLAVRSKFWYVQGPTSVALEDGEDEFFGVYKFGYKFLKPWINLADKKLVKDMGEEAMFVIANSKFCASLYQKLGVKVNTVIYPPIDCKIFHPRSASPSSDYVLTYFGKEVKFSVVKAVADLGIKIKAFGAKLPFQPKFLMGHPNINFLGKVPIDELVDLYSNALFTLFPFTNEPFGYVPVESMACGTPVLTYNAQGPRESVINKFTGWLVESDVEIVREALRLWRQGYAHQMRSNCVKVASRFDKKLYGERWMKIIESQNIE
jgi:glycosyltransferase involved in cell wall biosynthesis